MKSKALKSCMGQWVMNEETKIGEDEKYCPECRQVKYLDDFHIDPSTKDFRHWRCKSCKNKYTIEHTKLKKAFEKLTEYHGISQYPKIKKTFEPDIKCEKCMQYKSPSIMFKNISHYRQGHELYVCRECIAKNEDDIAFTTYEPVPFLLNKDVKKAGKEHNKEMKRLLKKEKKDKMEHWKAFLDDDGIDTKGLKKFDV